MGMLVDGLWTRRPWTVDESGRFRRQSTSIHGEITPGGRFAPEAGRYHLYVSWACPWACRTVITRALRKLENVISMSVVDSLMTDEGWHFGDDPDCTPDTVNGVTYLREIYRLADPHYTGRVTVPVLWDKREKTIVDHESRRIMRMLNTVFGEFADPSFDLRPKGREQEIDRTLDELYEPVNNGVYRAGFARSQEAYDEAVEELFGALDHWERVLAKQRFVLGSDMTEADICLFTTLFRFDPVYHTHFKCNLRRIVDYPNLWGFVRDVYQTPGVKETCKVDQIKRHYYQSHESVNPTRIVARGPIIDYDAPHDRAHLSATREGTR